MTLRTALLPLFLVLGLGGCAHAATLTVTCTAPTMGNDAASCSVPQVLVPMPQDSLWLHLAIPTAGVRDSVWLAKGMRFLRSFTVPAGIYPCTTWAAVKAPSGKLVPGCLAVANLPALALPAAPTIGP